MDFPVYPVVSVSRGPFRGSPAHGAGGLDASPEGEIFRIEGFSHTRQGAAQLLKRFWEAKEDDCLRAYVVHCPANELIDLAKEEGEAIYQMPPPEPYTVECVVLPGTYHEKAWELLKQKVDLKLQKAIPADLPATISVTITFG